MTPQVYQIAAIIAYFGSYGEVSALGQVVQMGVCENRASLNLRCVMHPSDCHSTENFLTVQQQRVQNKHIDCPCTETPAYLCHTPNNEEQDSICVSNESSCDTANGNVLGSEEESDDQCSCAFQSISENIDTDDSTFAPAYYGACRMASNSKKFFCAFQPSDCEGSYEWVQPKDTKNVIGTECNCNMVRTGGCYSGLSGVTCSTSGDVCGEGTFFGPISLKERYGESCRLCNEQIGTIPSTIDMIDLLAQKEANFFSLLGVSMIFIILIVSRRVQKLFETSQAY